MNTLKSCVKSGLFRMGLNQAFANSFGVLKTLQVELFPFSLSAAKLPPKSQSSIEHLTLRKGDLVFDIGANVGDVSAYFLSLGCEVVAFEPNPVCFAFLQKRFRGNQNIKLMNCAVSNYEGSTTFYIATESVQSSSLVNRSEHYRMQSVEAKVCDIAQVLRNTGRKVRLMKIDIEGGEYEVLGRLLEEESLSSFDFCVVETHLQKIPSLQPKHDKIVSLIQEKAANRKISLDWH